MRVRSVLFTLGLALSFPLTATAGAHEDGQCFGRTVRSPVVSAHRERVKTGAGHWETRRTAARYAVDIRRTLIRPARFEQVNAPARYRTVVRWQETPGAVRRVHTAPRYETRSERVLVQPAHAEWRRQAPTFAYGATATGQTMVQPTGEVLCRVWCPAKYETRTRRVMVSPGAWTTHRAAPQRKKIVERRLVRAAGTVQRRIPAQYRTERTRRLIQPGASKKVWVSASYRTVIRQRAQGGGEGWSRVVCSGPLSPAFRAQLQGALNARGYDAGAADGGERTQTYQALRRYQRDHRMAEGHVTVESARSLGLVP